MKVIYVKSCDECPQPSQCRPGYCARARKEIPGGILADRIPSFCPLAKDVQAELEEKIDLLEDEKTALEEQVAEFEPKEEILYDLARLARNTDGIHPSTQGPEVGRLLLNLRLLDGSTYALKVM